jgi:hypothetical protein
MIFPSAPLLLAELEALVETGADITVPRTSHGFEPFHAVYRRKSCLPLVAEALAAGERRATAFFPRARVLEFSTEEVLRIDPRGGLFVNVNTPEELAIVERRLLNGEISERDATADVSARSFAVAPEPSCSGHASHACCSRG